MSRLKGADLITVLNVTDLGAKLSARKHSGVTTVAGSAAVTVPGGTFTTADIGKPVAIWTDTAGLAATTIAGVSDATHITLNANASASSSVAHLAYGPSDSTAIQNTLNLASALVGLFDNANPNQPYGSGHVTVLIPGSSPHSLAMLDSQIVVPSGVRLEAHGSLVNALPSRNAFCVDVRPYAIVERIEVLAAFGTGVNCGTNSQQAHIVLGDVRVWHCGGATTAPTTLAGSTSTTGGTLSANTRYYVVTAIDAYGGETLVSNEVSITSTGATSSNSLTWDAYAGAVSYRIYRGTASGAQNLFFTSATNSFTDTGGASTNGYPIGPGVSLALRGYHYEARSIWSKISRLGVYHNAGSDCVVDYAYIVGAKTGLRFNASNQVKYTTCLLDTCGGSGSLGGIVLDNGCSNIVIDGQAFQVNGSGTTLAPVVAMGPLTSTAKQTFCEITMRAEETGGTLLSLANSQDCKFRLVGSNTQSASSTATAITTAVAYGSGLAGFISVEATLSSNIAPSSGTPYGTFNGAGFPVAKAANYTMTVQDGPVLASGTITVTLPAAASAVGRYTVKNVGTGTVTVAPAAGTIDGAANFTMVVQYSSVDFISDGTNWFTV
jgi:hypothetical protein